MSCLLCRDSMGKLKGQKKRLKIAKYPLFKVLTFKVLKLSTGERGSDLIQSFV